MAGAGRGIRIAIAIGAVAAAVAGLVWGLGPTRPGRPNIVLVVWDTCRADRLSAYGYGKPTTPWLEGFARDAVIFKEAFSPSPWTPPAHASLFTGLLPEKHGLLHGKGDRVPRHVPLLAETLRAAGYETIGFSSNAFISGITGLDAGLDRIVPLHSDAGGIGTAEQVQEAVESWLRERRNAPHGPERPLFVFINMMDAHLPRRPWAEDLRAVLGSAAVPNEVARAIAIDQREAVSHLLGVRALDAGTLDAMGTVYDASVHHLDRKTGEILERMRADGILDHAVVAITGDHGEHLGEHGHLSHQMSLYDSVLRIPMVVRWPGRLEGGRIERAQVRLQDLHPTLLEAAGVAPPPGTALDARSLGEDPLRSRLHRATFARPLPYLDDARKEFPGAPESVFDRFSQTLRAAQEPTLVDGSRKLIGWERGEAAGPGMTEREELFDLAKDPREEKDLLQGPSAEKERAAADRLRTAK
jgi:arylsulfatase A-like enzyme